MMNEDNLSRLEREVKGIFRQDSNITIELSDLSRELYDQLGNFFRKDYEVKETVNVFRREDGDSSHSLYILHISQRSQNA